MHKLSIITVCKDAAESIEKTIDSVINQAFRDFEYIIIDGASTDGTIDIINKYRDRITKLISEPDSGIYNAMNKGIGFAEGEYLMFLNAGDYLINSEVLGYVFKNEANEDIIYGDIVVLLKSGSMIRKRTPKKISKSYMFYDTIPHQSVFIKKELFLKYGLYDEKLNFAADFDFFLKTIFKNNCSLRYIEKNISVYNYWGVTSFPENRKENNKERSLVLRRYLSVNRILVLELFKPVLLFIKYTRYFIFYLTGKFSKLYFN